VIKLLLLLFGFCLWASPIEDARKALTDAAHSKEGDVRREAALALSLVPVKDSTVALLDRLVMDKDYRVRVASVDTLGELNDRARVGLVKAALRDQVPEVAFAAAKALYHLKDPAGVEALLSVYEGETKARSNYFQKEIRDDLRRLKTPRSAFFFAVKNGVGFVPVPGVGAGYNALMGVLSDSEVSARAVSLITVCGGRNALCYGMLPSAFDDDDWTVRAAAIHIATAGDIIRLQPKVANLIQDKKTKVRLRAAAGYLTLQASRSAKPNALRPTRKPGARATAPTS